MKGKIKLESPHKEIKNEMESLNYYTKDIPIILFKKFQIEMINEENSELIKELCELTKLISKLRRKSRDCSIEPEELIENDQFQVLSNNIAKEIGDVINIMDQFDPDFADKVEKYRQEKKRILMDKILRSKEYKTFIKTESNTNKK